MRAGLHDAVPGVDRRRAGVGAPARGHLAIARERAVEAAVAPVAGRPTRNRRRRFAPASRSPRSRRRPGPRMPSSSCRCRRTTRRAAPCHQGRGRTRIGDRAGRLPPPRSDRGSRSSPSRRRRCARTGSSASHRRRRNHRGDRSGCSARARTRSRHERRSRSRRRRSGRGVDRHRTGAAARPEAHRHPAAGPERWIEAAVGGVAGQRDVVAQDDDPSPWSTIATAVATLPPRKVVHRCHRAIGAERW